jgi:hypothetical protein
LCAIAQIMNKKKPTLRLLYASVVLAASLSATVKGQEVDKLDIIGEKVSIGKETSTENGFKTVAAKYKVLEVISGRFDGEFIEFQAALVSLSDSKRAMLSLIKESDGSYRLIYSSAAFSIEDRGLRVFVGSKISIEPFEPKYPDGTIVRDNAFKAKYRIVQAVYGKYKTDTIEFEVYDHYGIPAFSTFDNVLLYVSEGKDGKLYHEKYMFSPVYPTKGGRWAAPYESDDYNHPYNKDSSIRPEEIDYVDKVEFSILGLKNSQVKESFPPPYFRIDGDKAVSVMGNYVEDLLTLKLNGYLKARGYIDY